MHESSKKQVTGDQIKLLNMPPVSQSLPIRFDDTGFHVKSLGLTCGACKASIPEEQAFGSVARLIPSVVDLDCMGVCRCGTATPFRIRVRSDRTVEWRDADGQWQTYTVYAPNRQGLKHALKDMFSVIRERFS